MKNWRLTLVLRAALAAAIVFGLAACSNAGGGGGSGGALEDASNNSFVGTTWGLWDTSSNSFFKPSQDISFTTTTSVTYVTIQYNYSAIDSNTARIKDYSGGAMADFKVNSSDSTLAVLEFTSGYKSTWKKKSGSSNPYGGGTRVNPIVDHENAHSITIKDGIANGRVRTDWTSAKAGEKVPLIVEPSVGYLLDAITVTTVETSSTVTASWNGSTCSWEFTMPSACVVVNATFVVDPSAGTGRRDPSVDHENAHSITIKDGIANGSVRSDWNAARVGEKVPIRVEPASGYKLGSLTVTTVETSSTVTATSNSSTGLWEFTMPSACVEVSATFVLN